MKKIKRLFPRSSDREATASEDFDNSTGGRGLNSESILFDGQAKNENGPWGLKELCAGKDPILE